jgi:beta-glucanase (GH16 family)
MPVLIITISALYETTWYDEHGDLGTMRPLLGGVHKGPDKSADFHTYGLGWTETTMVFYFDDTRWLHTATFGDLSTKAMYIIINLAIGGWAMIR